MTIRKEDTSTKPLATIDPGKILLTEITSGKQASLSDLMEKRSTVVVLLDPDSEPSKHILNDLGPNLIQFNRWKGCFLFVNVQEKGSANAVFHNYHLPAKSSFTIDSKNELAQVVTSLIAKEAKNDLPAVLFVLPKGEVRMLSTGYKIGMGESLVQLIQKLENEEPVLTKASCTTP